MCHVEEYGLYCRSCVPNTYQRVKHNPIEIFSRARGQYKWHCTLIVQYGLFSRISNKINPMLSALRIGSIWKQPWQLPQRQMFPCMESEDAESSELLQANEQFSGEGQTFTLSPRLVSSAPGGGCLLLRTPGLNLRQWPEPSFGCWTIFRLFLEHTLEYWWSNKFVFVNWLRPDPWITNTPDRESRERSKSSHR